MLASTLIVLALGITQSQPSEIRTPLEALRISLAAKDDGVRSIAFSPDGKLLASGTIQNRIILWDSKSGQEVAQAKAAEGYQGGYFPFLFFSPDGKKLATVHDTHVLPNAERGRIRVWRITEKGGLQEQNCFRFHCMTRHCGVCRAAFSPDGKMLAAASGDSKVVIWDLETGRERLRFRAGVAAAFSPDGRSLISVEHDGQVHRWIAGTTQHLGKAPTEPHDFIHADSVVFGPSGRLLAIGDGFTTVLKDAATGEVLRRIEFPDSLIPTAISPEDKLLVAEAKDGLHLFDTGTGKEVARRPGFGISAFSHDGRFAWSNGASIIVEKLPLQAKHGGGDSPSFEPTDVPLQARIILHRKDYALDLGDLSPKAFSNQLASRFLPTPLVDLTFELRNTGSKPVTISRSGRDLDEPQFWLVGPGAMNLSELDSQVFVMPEPTAKPIILAPGACYRRQISSLYQPRSLWTFGDSHSSYWLLPGEYVLYARCHGAISPSPKGAHDAGEGFSYVSLSSPPVKITVSPARAPSADPLAQLPLPPLGAATTRPNSDAEVRAKLSWPVGNLTDRPARLQTLLAYLAARYDLNVRIDEDRFKRAGREDISTVPAALRLPGHVNLRFVLHALLEPLDATCEVCKGTIWIVPASPQSLAERLPPADDRIQRKLYGAVASVPNIPKGTPLADALQQLSEQLHIPIVVDHWAFDRAGIKNVDQRPVELAKATYARLSILLRELLQPARAIFVAREGVILVVPPGK